MSTRRDTENERRRLAMERHRDVGHPEHYDGPCWGPTPEDYEWADRQMIPKVAVHFIGGPWAGQTFEIDRVVGPLFGVGHEIGKHYWLDTKSDPPTYHWDGGE